ncbi:MAG: hypothetical protein V1809_06830, partial [Planctomycetota bacterium]
TPTAPPPCAAATGYAAAQDAVVLFNDKGQTWVLKIERAGEAPPPPPSAFRAEWKDLKPAGETPRWLAPPSTAMLYDSKRKRCVLFDGAAGDARGGGKGPSEMWALDLAATRWTCLGKRQPGDTGDKRAWPVIDFPHFRYGEAGDAYWILDNEDFWICDPAAGTWKQEGLPAGMPNWRSGNVRSGWAYDPDGRRFMRRYSGHSGSFFFYPEGRKVEKLPESPEGTEGYVDGGLAYDRKNKVFVLLPPKGGTWTFDPAAKAWREMKPAVSPPARSMHNLLWHEKLGALVMAGGRGEGNGNWFNDLWIYETAADRWTELKPPTAFPTGGSATAYDASQDVVVLVNDKGQTWALKIERAGEKK